MKLVKEDTTLTPSSRPKAHQVPHFAFVDADNLKRGLETRLHELKIPEDQHSKFVFSSLFQLLNCDRTYVYSAIKEGEDPPKWLKDIRGLKGVVLKLGTLTEKNSGPEKILKQEGVDVKLAIDATRFAYTSTMKSCTLFGADGDFIPLVETLSESGCIVNIASFNNPERGRVAPQLQAVADSYLRINGAWIYDASDRSQTNISIMPDAQHGVDWNNPHKIELVHGVDVKIWENGSGFLACLDESKKHHMLASPNLDVLLTWAKLNYTVEC